jgi:serine/threonine protein phosphatase PrpC
MTSLRYSACSEVGLVRPGNQDAAYAGGHLLAVADGMGGHAGGEVASRIAIDTVAELDREVDGDPLDALGAAIGEVNRRLRERADRDPDLFGMGTTLTAMLWNGLRVAFAHIGDSRAYLLRGGVLYQLTHDHTLVQALVDDGRITPEQAATHPRRALLSRALDGGDDVKADLWVAQAEIGDRYLLCTDGLSGPVASAGICGVLETVPPLDTAVLRLVGLAYDKGAPDNVTCIVAEVTEPGSPGRPLRGGMPIRLGSAASSPL